MFTQKKRVCARRQNKRRGKEKKRNSDRFQELKEDKLKSQVGGEV